ncbi:Pentatricopeptide repeat-containing protein [Raphanus sativus]|uniref:Pentatricopeptide repeat-containing protein At5g40400 n=1 Tax=Raphanus sativus TaxID=3726 RepID=A0A6J0NH94_RAPSA|nr:pentatricopeptide repeat-containing protein At5g40400 [Raphanus sativus]KAJ4902494.1 Pentatricopeptide repeat-containing protein [Raphanus sativus]
MKRVPAINATSLLKRDFSNHLSSSSSSLQLIPRCDDPPKPIILNPLYNLLPNTQNPNRIVDVICSSLNQQRDFLPSNLHNSVKSLIPHLGHREISRVLLRFQSDATRALSFFNWVKSDSGLTPNVGNYCLLLHVLAWSKKFPLAMQFLCELIELVANKEEEEEEDVFSVLVSATDECNWDPVVFDMLVKAYLKLGLVEEGYSVFRKVVAFGFRVSVVTCNHLLNGLLKLDLTDDCWRVYRVMRRVGILPNAHTINVLTNVFCNGSSFNQVNEFLEKMEEEEGFEPDLVTYNTLVSSYCRRGRLKEAFYLYKIMYRRRVVPDLVTYTCLIKGLCKEGRVREAHQTFHRMVDRGIKPDCVSYNTLIYAYCKEGVMEQAKRLLHEMLGSSVVPDRFTCKIIVEGFVRGGRLLAAVNFVVELTRLRVRVPFEVCSFLMESLCREGKPFAAKHLLERITEEEGREVKLETYNSLIESFSRCDAIDEALLLKGELTSQNQVLGVESYRALIGCLCRIGRYREAESLMVEMIDSEVKPDSCICGALVNGYCKVLDFAKAESLLSFFAVEFRIFDIESYNLLVKAICETGSGYEKVLELQERMQRVGFVPNTLSCKYMIQGLSQRDGLM